MAMVESLCFTKKRKGMDAPHVMYRVPYECGGARAFEETGVLWLRFEATDNPDLAIELGMPPKTALIVAGLICKAAGTDGEADADI